MLVEELLLEAEIFSPWGFIIEQEQPLA